MKNVTIAAGLLLGATLMFSGCKTKKTAMNDVDEFLAGQSESTENTTSTASEKNDKGLSWPSKNKDAEKKIVMKEEEASILSGENADIDGFKYFVIIGSFANENNARNYKVTMAEKGFKPTILANTTGHFRVAVFYSNNEQEARAKITEIRNSYPQHQDVWLLNRKGI